MIFSNQLKIQDFIIEQPLKEMFSFFGMLINKNKNNIAKLKKLKWRLNPRWRRKYYLFFT
jgi:hypothetical protein